jgi:hypothetical protein
LGLLSWLRSTLPKRSGGVGGALGVFNELYQPSAHASQIVVEERREAIKPKPSPEDKPSKKENPTG